MKLSQELNARGFINQYSGDSLESILDEKEPELFIMGLTPQLTPHTQGIL